MDLPDLSRYRLHRRVRDASFEGVPVPGLTAAYYRRADGDRVRTAGRYELTGRPLLLAWGYLDEEHCRWSAVFGADGRWGEPTPGCPKVRVRRDGRAVVEFAVWDGRGRWVGGPVAG